MTHLPYVTAMMLGSLHAFEADHLAAVTSFVVRKPQPRDAMRFGMQWAMGHGGAVLIAGALILFIGLSIPETATNVMERFVGVALVALGVWTAWLAHRAHKFAHAHTKAPAAIGLLHGIAGAAPAVALIPLAASDTAVRGVSYLMLFALGTLVAMSGYALAAGYVAHRSAMTSHRVPQVLGKLTGISTIAIGIIWMI